MERPKGLRPSPPEECSLLLSKPSLKADQAMNQRGLPPRLHFLPTVPESQQHSVNTGYKSGFQHKADCMSPTPPFPIQMQRLVTEGLAAWQVTWRPREFGQHQDHQGQLGVPGQQPFKDCCACILKAGAWGIKVGRGFSHVNVLFKCTFALGRLSPSRN